MSKYVIVSILDSEYPTTFIQADWPLHVTLLRPFSTNLTPEELVRRLGAVCKAQEVIVTKGKSKEMFGPNADVPVTELELTPELHHLHNAIKSEFESLIEFTASQYPNFRAHVTENLGREVDVGGAVELKTVSLVELASLDRKVIETFELK